MADPDRPSTSLLAVSLPRYRCESGQCWVFIPEQGDPPAASGGPPTRMREFFKMMVLRRPVEPATPKPTLLNGPASDIGIGLKA